MRAVILFLALLGSAMAAVPKRTPGRIVGGEPTNVEEYRFMANMQYHWLSIAWYQYCGGTLVNNAFVVTAAHCVENERTSQWRVRLGTSKASSGGTVYQAQKFTVHPQYNSRAINNDVALVKLSTTVAFNNAVGPANLPSATYNLADNSVVTTLGWGDLDSGGPAPEQLQKVDINVINQEVCAERYASLSRYPDITDKMLCAGVLDVGGKDACQGDSGGPLVHQKDTLVGIVSWGYDCAHKKYPGVYTRVSQFTDWIVANAK